MEVFGDGICTEVLLSLQGIEICDRFFALELGSLDVILGIQWLEKLGTVAINWKTQTMKLQWNGEMCDTSKRPGPSMLQGLTKIYVEAIEG